MPFGAHSQPPARRQPGSGLGVYHNGGSFKLSTFLKRQPFQYRNGRAAEGRRKLMRRGSVKAGAA
ncbi:hypothetical protein RZS08_53055, partial [Arthrospira platensis SPKY1]|nr:hypothetical protein [Arthrospira platensis SPKY1]